MVAPRTRSLASNELALGPLDGIEAAAVAAIAYADVFDWPLSAAEIHRYLPVPARRDQVEAALVSPRLGRLTCTARDLYALRGREEVIEGRQQRAAVSARLWRRAIRYGRLLACLPWVHLVAVTGSLAVGAATEDADIDLLLVTEEGRLWLTRALTIGLAKTASRLAPTRDPRLCPNYLLTASAFELPERDLYTAHELAQLVPLAGPAAYRALLEQNDWYREFLPNHPGHVGPIGRLGALGARRLVEVALDNSMVDEIERWEMDRKVCRLNVVEAGSEARFDETICKGHFGGHRRHVLEAFVRRVERLEVGEL
jgi:hypothetical protein